MSHRRDDRNRACGNGSRHDLLVEVPQIFNGATAAADDENIATRVAKFFRFAQFRDRLRDFHLGSPTLHAHGIKHRLDPRRATGQYVQNILQRRPGA